MEPGVNVKQSCENTENMKEEALLMNKNLTVGKPETVLWKFCLPLFGSIIFQQLYNIADSFVTGKFIGEDALAAVGNSYEVTLVLSRLPLAVILAAPSLFRSFSEQRTTAI